MQAANLYMFVMHNPVRWVDPTGLSAVEPPAGSNLGPTRPRTNAAPGPADVFAAALWMSSGVTPASVSTLSQSQVSGAWGAVRDFVDDLELIFGYSQFTFSDHGSATITLGSGHLMAQGEVFFDGRIGANINGRLHMCRADFYRTMGINFVQSRRELTITATGFVETAASIIVSSIVSELLGIPWYVTTAIGIGVAGASHLMATPGPGNFVVYSTLAFVYIPMSGGRHEGILTHDFLRWETDFTGGPVLVRPDGGLTHRHFFLSL